MREWRDSWVPTDRSFYFSSTVSGVAKNMKYQNWLMIALTFEIFNKLLFFNQDNESVSSISIFSWEMIEWFDILLIRKNIK